MKNKELTTENLKSFMSDRGQAALVVILALLSTSSILVVSLGAITFNEIKKLNNIVKSAQSYYVSEAGIEDAVLRIQNRMNYTNPYTLTVGDGSTVLVVSGTGSKPIVTSKGSVDGRVRKLQVGLQASSTATNIAFNYGVQVGYGGLHMDNNSRVTGNVYSNGPVTSGPSNPRITGTIFAASGAAAVVDQENSAPIPSLPVNCPPTANPLPNCITFGKTDATQDAAQSFQVSTTDTANKVELYMKKEGGPKDLWVRIVNDNGGKPGATEFTKGQLQAGWVGSNFSSWVTVSFESSPQLNAGVTYWLVLDGDTSSSKYYVWAANSSYTAGTAGEAKTGQYSAGPWNATSLDGYFRLYLGGVVGSIDGIDIGTGGTGDGNANTITGSTATGTLYCQTGSGNNKPCNTSKPDPLPEDMPISEANINQFKSEAAAGGTIIGDYTPSGGSSSLGPKEITGNLTVPGGHILTITGTVWVHGYITFGNGAQIRLHPSYMTDSGLILADGYIYIDNGVIFTGSGQAGSYIMTLTTNDCNGTGSPTGQACTTSNSAMYVANNSQNIVLYAANGQMRLKQNVATYEATAYRLYLEENVVVTYEAGLVNANFTSGPGAGYEILRWEEIE